ncbi:MAG: hypothetical protein WCX31_17255 [Salinivirgaceae bacterium]
MISLFAGFGTSVLHVISGPDHLAAVTPLALSSRLKSWFVGLFWGLGHVFGALIIGGLFILMRGLIPIDSISEYSEQLVGIILIAIGIWALWKIRHKDHHQHKYELSKSKTMISALSIGIVHGLAGVSHIIGILPTLALPTRADAVFYLTGFTFGTIITMVTYSFILGLITHKTVVLQKHSFYKRINAVGGIFAIAVGLYWIGTTWYH